MIVQTVAALLQSNASKPIKTFTIGFEEAAYNEAEDAKKIASHLGASHFEHYCTEKDALSLINDLPQMCDEPLGDSSCIPTLLVSKFAKQEVDVALSADGGDETFAGYSKYFTNIDFIKKIYKSKQFLKIPNFFLKTLFPYLNSSYAYKIDLIHNILGSASIHEVAKHKIDNRYFDADIISMLLDNPPDRQPLKSSYDDYVNLNQHNDYINSMLAIDYKTYMVDDVLQKVDRATMYVSLEGREPLLDHRFIEFLAQCPSHIKYRQGVSKFMLKEIAHKYIPKNLFSSKKKGFGVPMGKWLNNELAEKVNYYFSEAFQKKYDFLNAKSMRDVLSQFQKNDHLNNATQVWLLLNFSMWMEEWL